MNLLKSTLYMMWMLVIFMLAGCNIQSQSTPANTPVVAVGQTNTQTDAQAEAPTQATPPEPSPSPLPPTVTPPASPTPVVTITANPTTEVETDAATIDEPQLEPESDPTPAPTVSSPDDPDRASEPAAVPSPVLFETAWNDRSVFQAGLIDTQQDILNQLSGATVYHIDLQIDDSLNELEGQEELLYTNQENVPLNEIYIRLFPNILDGSATVSNVWRNNQPVEPIFELRNSAMQIPLSTPLLPGEQVVIKIDFAVQVPNRAGGNYGIFAFLEDVLALSHFYPIVAVYDDEGWNIEIPPRIGDVIYADTSFYRVRVTAPASQTLAASGIEIDRELTAEQQIVTFAAGPVRDFYLAASDRYDMVSRTVGQTTINSYAPAELTEGAEAALEFAARAMESFNERIGPYPFTEFDIVSTTTFALGIEYPGIVAILIDLYNPEGRAQAHSSFALMESVVVHEVAHQWFYSAIGNDQVDEPWLDEALAQYATLLYYEDVYGPSGADSFRSGLNRRWERINQADIPIGLPVRDYTSEEYSAIVYGRGPLFIEALAETMGQETFAEFLRAYYQTYQWDIASGDSFKQLAERHCECDLTPLFEAWVLPDSE